MIRYLKSRRYFILLSILLLGLMMIPIMAEVSVALILKPEVREYNVELKYNYPRILEDLATLEANPIFKRSEYNNNAEFLISKHVPWEGIANPLITKSETTMSVQKISKVYFSWRTLEDQFENLMSDKALLKVDTSWLKKLDAYDSWNFSTNKELTSALASIPHVNALARLEIFSQLPSPNYDIFKSWALLNFIKLEKKGKAIEGLRTYRKIANLMHSSNTIVGNITAASMLKDEYTLVSKFNIKGWTPVPVFYIDAYIRTTWAWMGILKVPYFDTLPVEFLAHLKPETGLCASSRESISNFSLYLDLYQPQTRFETNFSDNVIYTTHLYKKIQNVCNLQIYNTFLERSPASISPWSSFKIDRDFFKANLNTDYDFSIEDNWIYLPYVRRIVGTVYFANGSPMNFVSHYERKHFMGSNYADAF